MVEISERNNVMRLSSIESILEALGWFGFVIILLAVTVMIGTIAVSILFDWEYGIRLLLFGIGLTLGLGFLVIAVSEFLRPSSSKVVRCTYCGMENMANAVYCMRCGKVLPKHKDRLPRPRYPPKL